MSRLPIRPAAEVPETATALFAQIRKAVGRLPNAYEAIGSYSPATLATVLGADAALAKGALSRQEIEAIRPAVSEIGGCDYCVAAHTMIGGKTGLDAAAMRAIRAGEPSGDARRDALLAFVRSVVRSSGTVPADTLAAVQAAGYGPQQIIEALLVVSMISFTNLFNRVNDTDLDFPRPE